MSISVAALSLGSSILGGLFSAYGAIQQGKAQSAQLKYQAQVAENNKIRAQYLQEDALKRGQIAERQERLRGRLLIGQMRSAIGSSGAIVDQGSALDLTVDQAGVNELDALNVRNSAAREAQGFEIQGQEFGREAVLSRNAASTARSNALLSATGTLLGTAGSVADKWYRFNQKGA